MDSSPPGSSVRGISQAGILSRLPFPSPGDRPNPGTEPRSPALQAGSLLTEPPGKPAHEVGVDVRPPLVKRGSPCRRQLRSSERAAESAASPPLLPGVSGLSPAVLKPASGVSSPSWSGV